MSSPAIKNQPATIPEDQLRSKIRMVQDALLRVLSNAEGNGLTPGTCAYIDGQLAKAIGWLASARAVVIEEGTLLPAHFDNGDVVDLDDPRGLVERFEDATQPKGGAS